MPPYRPRAGLRRVGLPLALARCRPLLGGCSMFGGSAPRRTASTTPTHRRARPPAARPTEGEIDVRRYLGPDYCPELRVLNGAEFVRRYERGHEDDAELRRSGRRRSARPRANASTTCRAG